MRSPWGLARKATKPKAVAGGVTSDDVALRCKRPIGVGDAMWDVLGDAEQHAVRKARFYGLFRHRWRTGRHSNS